MDTKNQRFFSASTKEITKSKDTQRFDENRYAAKECGTVAGIARKELEKRSMKKVTTSDNYLEVTKL